MNKLCQAHVCPLDIVFCLVCLFSPVMSENYIVFIEQPIKLDLLRFMLYRVLGKSFHKVMTWEPQYGTIFHLVNRHTGMVGEQQQSHFNSKLWKKKWLFAK